MSDSKPFSFFIDPAGHLRAADFKPRCLKKVIESALGEDWKKSPKKLHKSMLKSPDVYAAVFEARQRMIPQYIARYEELHDKVRELSAQGLKAMELTKDGLPSHDDLREVEANDIFETYAETRRDALRCHRALLLMQKTALCDWIDRMDGAEFKGLVSNIKTILDRNVQKSDSVFCTLKDSPEGVALSILMEAAPAAVKPIGFSQMLVNGSLCAVISERKEFKSWCEEHGYELTEARACVSSVESNPKETQSSTVRKEKAKVKIEKSVKNDKVLKSVKLVRSEVEQSAQPQTDADAPKLAVRIIKTEAKLATATPKALSRPSLPASNSQAVQGLSESNDLASRLVRSLQIKPSAVEHRAPGRPRKSSSTIDGTPKNKAPQKADGAHSTNQAVSTRPASRNKSGSPKP